MIKRVLTFVSGVQESVKVKTCRNCLYQKFTYKNPDEFSATPAGDLQCNLCKVLVKCDKKVFVENHQKK